MKNFVSTGDVVTISAPIAVTSGQFLSVSLLRGFCQTDAELYAPVALVTRGVFSATVSAPEGEVVVGQAVYAIDGTTLSTVAPEGTDAREYVGVAVSAALAQDGVATVDVKLG
jgi:predicted RecA/RadA family phage recombinase